MKSNMLSIPGSRSCLEAIAKIGDPANAHGIPGKQTNTKTAHR